MSNRSERRAAERLARKTQPNPAVRRREADPEIDLELDEPFDADTLAIMERIHPGFTEQEAERRELHHIITQPNADIRALLKARWERKKAGLPPLDETIEKPTFFTKPASSETPTASVPPTTTAAQIAANQSNAQLSTGPVTSAGKAAVSTNRRTHGLTGRFTVLTWENAADYHALAASLYAEHQPETDTEQRLVDSLIQHHWLKERAIQLQENLLAHAGDPAEVDAQKLSLFLRYQTTHERSYYKAHRELKNLRKEKRQEQIGFESQNQKQEAHEARIRLTNARATNLEIDTACRQVMEVPIPGNTRIPFEEVAQACSTGIATLIYQKQRQSAA